VEAARRAGADLPTAAEALMALFHVTDDNPEAAIGAALLAEGLESLRVLRGFLVALGRQK
jgi:hypothetical protein